MSYRQSPGSRAAKTVAVLSLWFFCLPLPTLWSQATQYDRQISGEFWTSLEPLHEELVRPASDPQLIKDMLELARQTFSGMLYGWSFEYTPSDTRRAVKEIFEAKLMGSIPWGDQDLDLRGTRVSESDNRLYARFVYFPKKYEILRLDAWSKINLVTAGGLGRDLAETKLKSSLGALTGAIKESVRNYLRPRDFNKPKQVRGEVLLRRVPVFRIEAGYVVCQAEFVLRILDVTSYPEY